MHPVFEDHFKVDSVFRIFEPLQGSLRKGVYDLLLLQCIDNALRSLKRGGHGKRVFQNAAQQALRVRTLDDWALSSAIVGSSLLVAGVVLLFTAEDPKRYELPSARLTSSGANLEWQHAF